MQSQLTLPPCRYRPASVSFISLVLLFFHSLFHSVLSVLPLFFFSREIFVSLILSPDYKNYFNLLFFFSLSVFIPQFIALSRVILYFILNKVIRVASYKKFEIIQEKKHVACFNKFKINIRYMILLCFIASTWCVILLYANFRFIYYYCLPNIAQRS